MRPLSEFAILGEACRHMDLNSFIIGCLHKDEIMDSGGYGWYATETEVSDKKCVPSAVARGTIDRNFTHVLWFPK